MNTLKIPEEILDELNISGSGSLEIKKRFIESIIQELEGQKVFVKEEDLPSQDEYLRGLIVETRARNNILDQRINEWNKLL